MLKIGELKKYFSGKKVLVTGHTGFKGSYMCVLLKYLGAKTYGYALKPEKGSLYELLKKGVKSSGLVHKKTANADNNLVCSEVFADIRDEKKLTSFIKKIKPDYILHMAAQPLVLLGYEKPRYTYDVNVMGTVNLMEAIQKTYTNKTNSPVSILNVTTDKVYENNDLSNYAFKENDKLCGRDPYANSKSCSELVTYAYEKSFFYDKNVFRVSTARAGNVIGGGDLNKDRIIPDCYRAIKNKKDMFVRNPMSIRPYQFVLEPLILYLNILAKQKVNVKYEGNYNIGPDKKDCLTTKELVTKFYEAVEDKIVDDLKSAASHLETNNKRKTANNKSHYKVAKVIYNQVKNKKAKHEAAFLRLDNSLIKKTFNYKEIFNMNDTMKYTAKVYLDMLQGANIFDSVLAIIHNLS